MAMQIVGRERRKLRIRRKISGTAERPRLTVFRTAKHIYAQVIDDVAGGTLAHVSTLSRDVREGLSEGDKTAAAKKVGAAIAAALKAKGVDQGRLRPQRLPLPRPHRCAGRGRARSRPVVLNRN